MIRRQVTAQGRLPAACHISAAAVGRAALYLRTWQPGDRFRPLGLTGRRKLQDIFTDAKLSPAQRARLPLLVCRNQIIWMPGCRIAADWQVPSPRHPAWHIRLTALPTQPKR
ncbi:MAG: tRNA lysidine(34) synthetase TilS [Candidatus Marinimicrobia bacterium]|nr:tRNA lysidine(34) synthetase TilS [Candidatus Neomarinimicrobiota bacterium]